MEDISSSRTCDDDLCMYDLNIVFFQSDNSLVISDYFLTSSTVVTRIYWKSFPMAIEKVYV